MAAVWISLHYRQLSAGDVLRLPDGHHGIFTLSGDVNLNGPAVVAGDGGYGQSGDVTTTTGAEVLHFAVTDTLIEGGMLAEQVTWQGAECVFRLDQVSFPPGARAYRHTHLGPGIRCLTMGALEIRSDHHTEMMEPLSAWFEDADSPVQATAGDTSTAFVRAMLLPMDCLGQPTLNILDPDDLKKPRLQTNRRFFDQVLRLHPG